MTQLIVIDDVPIGDWASVRRAVYGDVWYDVRCAVRNTVWVGVRHVVEDNVWDILSEGPRGHTAGDMKGLS